MVLLEKIHESYQTATSYPDLVFKLITLGVQSYTVDVATGIVLYRFDAGEHVLNEAGTMLRQVANEFNKESTIQAVRDNQQGKTDYPGFMNDIAKAGVRFYEATFTGNLRVTYIGVGGYYEEAIPK